MHEAMRLGRAEQFVDKIAKPRLEHVHLALGDGHALIKKPSSLRLVSYSTVHC